jgi:hypothetical protein
MNPSAQITALFRRHLSHKVDPPQEKPPSLNLWSQIREARPAVRYTVYAGLGLMATAETTFWLSVIRAKYFPSSYAEEERKAEQLLESLQAAVKGFRAVWLTNYGKYYGAYTWGIEYGGLDAADAAEDC